jgi:signal transduction histidine kinase
VRAGQQGSGRRLRRTKLETRVFAACFGVLASLAAAHSLVLAVYWRATTGAYEWPLVLGVWLATLAPIAGVSGIASRWVRRRITLPMRSIAAHCRAVQAGRASRLLESAQRSGELAPLTVAIDAVLANCEQMAVRQHRCMADTAHELRTPLTAQAVVGENALAARATTAELRDAVSSMLEEAKHMRRLIDSMLALNSVSLKSADPARQPTPLELSALARDCVQSLQVLAEEKHQSLSLRLARGLWVDADQTLMRQALLNVMHNAIEHCPEGTEIEIETAECEGEGVVRVRDHGPGIPIEHQSRVFDRFYRGSGSSRSRGLGLGLSIAKAILTSQGGSIRLQSIAGVGCCFTLALRLSPPPQCGEPDPPAQELGVQARELGVQAAPSC